MATLFKLLFFFFLVSSLAQAQQKPDAPGKHELLVKLNLASVIDPTTPSLQAGLEYRFHQKWGAEWIWGPGFYLFYMNKNRDSLYHKSFKYKAALKYYGWKEAFIGAEFIHSDMRRNKFDGQYNTEEGNRFILHEGEIRRHYHALILKGGALVQVNPRLYLEVAGGFGGKIVETTVKGVNGEVPTPDNTPDYFYVPAATAGTQLKPHATGEFKVGFRIF